MDHVTCLSLLDRCELSQRAEFKQSAHESREVIEHSLSSRGETADRFEASGVESGRNSYCENGRSGDTLCIQHYAGTPGAGLRIQARVAPCLASSHVVTLRCDFHPSAADLGALGNTSRRASFCSHKYRRACNSLERKSSRIAQKFLTRAAAGLGWQRMFTGNGVVDLIQSSPLSIRPRRATGLSGGWARPYSPLELSSSLSQSRALPVPESQSAVTPVGISGSARGLGSAA